MLAFAFPNPIILLIALLGRDRDWRRWQHRSARATRPRAYYRVPPAHRRSSPAVYLGLIALLVLGMDPTHVARTLNDV